MIVDLLIRENPKDIQLNEQFLEVGGVRYTPIERATALRQEHVVRNLIHHGADVMRTDPHKVDEVGSLLGALDHAVCNLREGTMYLDIHPQLCLMLLEAGGDLSAVHMTTLLSNGQGEQRELAERIMLTNSHKEATDWANIDTLWSVIYFSDVQTAMRIVAIMLKLGVDLNEESKLGDSDRPGTIIDVAAQRGSLSLVDFLLDTGARLTDDTLPAAVKSGNKDLVEFLISKGADVNSLGRLHATPLAAAVRIKSAEIISMLETRGASLLKHFPSVFRAASDVGDLQLIERLMELKESISPGQLGYALTIAVKDGREEIAKILIDAGAFANVRADEGSKSVPLFYAVKQRKEALIYSLLEADADPSYTDEFDAPPIIQLATDWGNRSVIEALIFAGANLNRNFDKTFGAALTVAVKQRNSELVQLLLASGADVNNPENRMVGGTALEAAVDNDDIEMARWLLDQGADPNDSRALRKSAHRDKNVFELIFKRYCARYQIGRSKLGASLLADFIWFEDEFLIRLMVNMGVNADLAIFNDVLNKFGGPELERDERTTAFGVAISRPSENNNNLLEMFLQKGCNPNSVVFQSGVFEWDQQRVRPLITAFLSAIDTQSPSIVELFIKYEADVNFPARLGVKRTPLQRAAELGNLAIVDILVNRGADVNAPAAARSGGTALQLAVIGCYIPVARRLLSLGANVNAPGSTANGTTALEAAAEHGRLDMLPILFSAGAASRPGDEGQIKNAITLAKGKKHLGVCDLLEQHLHPPTKAN